MIQSFILLPKHGFQYAAGGLRGIISNTIKSSLDIDGQSLKLIKIILGQISVHQLQTFCNKVFVPVFPSPNLKETEQLRSLHPASVVTSVLFL